ncbi:MULTISPECIES: lactate/malate family dehydrogenase [unclassified Streptomyces]|uniref:lactate/malate family dehydrogenase n=1 Tax=unclassified Streptomyces TaxID=2593676 RepID=UPI0020252C5F|nr:MULTISPECIES: NAD(P)-binding domain-containing protein [unclassified Streptomyces]MCX4550631.1 NAD(P)-binding domain-containing protein [Streptomyces sp. NBC_01500]WSC22075.1 NAD(P)-binding domain-containing protein [Streptomyces sp. NBC_01766]
MSGPVVGIVGAGAVGQTLAASLVAAALPGRLLVVSRQPDQARGLTADLQDLALAAGSRTQVEPGEIADLYGCDAVVVALRTAFKNTAARDIRRGGAAANAPVLGALARDLRGYDGTVLVVTNPVDLMARRFAEVSGCTRVFGIGSNLDSARYRLLLARYAQVSPDLVRGHVIGEHGDRAVVCVSTTTVDSRPVTVPVHVVVEDLQRRPALIRTGIGRTRCGPAGAVLSTLRKTLGLVDGTEELSVPYGDVWLGIPMRFTGGRAEARLPQLTRTERLRLDSAASSLRDAYTHLPAHTERTTP